MGGLASKGTYFQKKFLEKGLRDFFGLDLETKREIIKADPYDVLKFIFNGYAFERDVKIYSGPAVSALEEFDCVPTPDDLWNKFKGVCKNEGWGINRKLNEGVVRGLTSLTRDEGNLISWIKNEIKENGKLDSIYLKLTENKGISQKKASFIIRDAVFLISFEDQIKRCDRLYLQPIDRWVKGIAKILFPNLHDNTERIVIAKILSGACTQFGISDIEFNQGAWYFGREEVERKELLRKKIKAI